MTGLPPAAVERDLPAVRRWLDDAVRTPVIEAAAALRAVRDYLDGLDSAVVICRERNGGRACVRCVEAARVSAAVRALLPVVSEGRDVAVGEVTCGRRPGPDLSP